MASKKKASVKKPSAPLTREQRIELALSPAERNRLKECPLEAIPVPTRTFEPGEPVGFGNRNNVVVERVIDGGKAVLVEMDVSKPTRGYGIHDVEDPTAPTREFQVVWWYELRKRDDHPKSGERLMQSELKGSLIQTAMDSIIHLMSYGGLVLDPRFQRGYVWSQEDADQLLDSVFDRLNIGSFVFVRNAGYLHEGSTATVTYRGIDGSQFTLPKRQDYTTSVVDGQQRLTTLMRFFLGSLLWRGRSFRSLHFHDQHDFYSTPISYRMIEEAQVKEADLYRMFLQVNRGVPQSPEHLANVREKLRKLETSGSTV
jgi:hypothetical protein